jgi:hypothetical protein
MRMLPLRSPVASWLPNGLILRHRAPSFGARELESELLKLVMFEMGRFVLAIVFDDDDVCPFELLLVSLNINNL